MKRIKLFLLTVLALIGATTTSLPAQETLGEKFKVDALYYRILSDEEVSIVPQKDEDPFWNDGEAPSGDIIIPKTVSYNGKTYRVVAIGENAFSESGITSVTIPNTVKKIQKFAFGSCPRLTSVTIPNSVTEFGWAPFGACTALSEIHVAAGSNSFKTIDGVLFDTDATQLIQYPAGKKEDSYVIPNSVKKIVEGAFSGSPSLTSVMIPNAVTEIAEGTFSGCTGLSLVKIPDSVKKIGRFAFESCISLTSVTIPHSVEEIGQGAFSSCTGLTSVTIPNSVKVIGVHAFDFCTSLTSVKIPNSVEEIGKYAFAQCRKLKTISSKIKDPNTVKLENYVFMEVDTKVCTLQVPKGSKALYQGAEQWMAFLNIEEVDYSATNAIFTPETKVWSAEGVLYIRIGESSTPLTARVYTPIGTQVAIIPLQDGENKLSMSSGSYLVQIAGETYKVLVP